MLRINGVAAQRLAALLSEVASPVIEVGPQRTSLPAVLDVSPAPGRLWRSVPVWRSWLV